MVYRQLLFCVLFAQVFVTVFCDVRPVLSSDEKPPGDGRFFDDMIDGFESAIKDVVSSGQAVITSKVSQGSNGVTKITQTEITKTYDNRNTGNRNKRGLEDFIDRLGDKIDNAKDKVKESATNIYEKIKDRVRNKRGLGDLIEKFGDKVDNARGKVKESLVGVVTDVINTGYVGVQKIKEKIQ